MEGAGLNISPLIIWVVALSQLLTFGLTVWNLMASGSRANSKRLEEQGKRLDDHDLRLGGMEQSQRALPSTKDMHELEIAMEQLKGELKTLTAVMSGQSAIMERLEAIVSRHEHHLLEGGRK